MKRAFAHIGFSFGAALFALNAFGIEFAYCAFAAVAAVFVFSLLVLKTRRSVSLPVCAGSALLACLLFIYAYNAVVLPQMILDGKTVQVNYYLTDLGTPVSTGYTYTAKIVSAALPGAPQGINVKLYVNQQIPAAGYQLISGKVHFESFGNNGFSSYGAWGKEIFLRANVKTYEVSSNFVASPMRGILELRYNIITAFMNSVGGEEGALSAGMLIGDRSFLSDEAINNFRIVGASHLTAVSGLHLGAVTGAFGGAFNLLKIDKRISSPIIILVIIIYCMLSGFSKSVVRAGIMLIILLVGLMFRQRADSLNSLGLALFVICLNPFAVCDISTLLTTLSMLAIITVYPAAVYSSAFELFKRKIMSLPTSKRRFGGIVANAVIHISELILLSFSIVVCNLPVMCLFFGYFSAIGIVLNTLLVVLGGFAVTLSLASVPFLFTGFLAPLFAYAVRVVNSLILIFVAAGARVPFATLNLGKNFVLIIGGALVIIGVSYFVSPRLVKKTAAVMIACVIIISAITTVAESKRDRVFITQSGAAAVCFGNETCVVGADSYYDFVQIKSYLTSSGSKVTKTVNCSGDNAELFSKLYGCDDDSLCDNYTVKIGELTFASGDNVTGNIVVCGNRVSDPSGIVDLQNGSVEYKISGSSYSRDIYSTAILT